TADKLAEAAVLFHQPVAIQRTLLVQGLIGLRSDARSGHQPPCSLAIRITRAGREGPKAPALQGHFLAAIFAIFNLVFRVFWNFLGEVLDEIAFRVARAAKEESVPADALQQLALAALLALFPGRDSGL